MKGSLTTISDNRKERNEVHRQLTELLGDELKINSICWRDIPAEKKISDDLLLVTSCQVKEIVLPYLKEECKYLLATRTLNIKNVQMLFNIPEGSRVLVVNTTLDYALEVIKELENMGLNHLDFYPYFPQQKIQRNSFDYALTTGHPHLVPKQINNILDLGIPLISIVTIVEILLYFKMSKTYEKLVNSRYLKDLIKQTWELNNHARENELLLTQIETIISEFDDGIIVTDPQQRIFFYNKLAIKFLEKSESIKGQKLKEVMPWFDEKNSSSFTKINDKEFYLKNGEVILGDNYKTRLITLKELNCIQDIDEKYRKHKKYSGYQAKHCFADIICNSRVMKDLIRKAYRIARTESTVLIRGESGTGKELLAQSIHNESKRNKYPFVAINCAALNENLLESELFGYEEGAFTGAKKGGKKGLFEIAHKGSIFLDEIGDAPLAIQAKLLRVLQEKEIMRVSGERIIPIDVRVIAATNRDLLKLIEEGAFRKDLYYRINILPLYVPPLRERKEDIHVLFQHFLQKYCSREKIHFPQMGPQTLHTLTEYFWPGNIRELENLAEYIATILPVSPSCSEIIEQFIASPPCNHTRGDRKREIEERPLFRDKETKEQARLLLHLLYENKKSGVIWGRGKLREALLKQGVVLSQQQIKLRLEYLKKAGLVQTKIGKGTYILPRGEELILRGEKAEGPK